MSVPDRDLSPWPAEDFVGRLRAEGVRRYHDQHPFHQLMHAGKLTRDDLATWTLNRYYYQTRIPIKDAIIVSKSEDPAFRRAWIRRVHDHDGDSAETGGLALWLRLAEAVGLAREEVLDSRHLIPAVRFAVDAYVNFARRAPWQEAVCSSLTELFAPEIHKQRLATWPEHYRWIEPGGLAYFRNRVSQARRDVEQALSVTLDYFRTRAEQERALGILKFKLDILWAMNDAMALKYGTAS